MHLSATPTNTASQFIFNNFIIIINTSVSLFEKKLSSQVNNETMPETKTYIVFMCYLNNNQGYFMKVDVGYLKGHVIPDLHNKDTRNI